jgi:hypothetical protein
LSPTDIYNGTKSDYVSTVLPKAANSSTPSPDRKRRSSTQQRRSCGAARRTTHLSDAFPSPFSPF